MDLSEERKANLDSLLHTWGVDRVREELARSEEDPFAEPEVIEFSRAWIAVQEAALRRKRWATDFLIFSGIVMVGALAVALFYL